MGTESLTNACWCPRGPSGRGQLKVILRENSLYRVVRDHHSAHGPALRHTDSRYARAARLTIRLDMNTLLFQLAPDDTRMRSYLRNHVLLHLIGGTSWRGTLSEWSRVKQTLTLTNAQVDGPALTGLGVASKTFRFDTVSEVRVADASPEVLAGLSPAQQELAKAAAASMARAAAEDARIESHRGMTELVAQADAQGLSFTELLIQRGLAKTVEDDDDDSRGGRR